MSTRAEKDRAKAQQEKFQAILSSLLKDEDNKYCEDCDAKGPRWASWNLGIFLCIRCAGIHRNLGVHISRVKSVNLDTWTPEQVAMMQEMGNSRARAVYEANVPDTFRRPQTDSALEAFIRAKYEQKKYIAREWVPPKPTVPKEWLEDDRDKKKARSNKIVTNLNAPPPQPPVQSTAPAEVRSVSAASSPAESKLKPQPQLLKPKSGSDDLLGLDAEVPQPSGGGQGGDLLADLFGGSPASAGHPATAQQNGSAEASLFDDGSSSGGGQGEKKSAKDSIMALYGSGGQQQMFGVPATEKSEPDLLLPERQPFAMACTAALGQQSAMSVYQPSADFCLPYYANTNPFVYTGTGGMYMPQQPMYSSMGAPPMMQQQGMMGQPMQQGIMGMQQQPGMFGGMGQVGGQQPAMAGGMGQMGGQQMGMMGGQGAMMGRPGPGGGSGIGGQMFMGQPGVGMQQPMGQQMPVQMQQMQFQQMQQQMAAMQLGSGQVGQPTAMAGGAPGSWGGGATGQTLSTNLWQ